MPNEHAIEFQFEGEAAELAAELRDLLAEDFADWPQHTAERTPPPDLTRKDLDSVQILTLGYLPSRPLFWQPGK